MQEAARVELAAAVGARSGGGARLWCRAQEQQLTLLSHSPTAEVAARLAAQYAPKSVTAQADKYVADSREVSDPEYVPSLLQLVREPGS